MKHKKKLREQHCQIQEMQEIIIKLEAALKLEESRHRRTIISQVAQDQALKALVTKWRLKPIKSCRMCAAELEEVLSEGPTKSRTAAALREAIFGRSNQP